MNDKPEPYEPGDLILVGDYNVTRARYAPMIILSAPVRFWGAGAADKTCKVWSIPRRRILNFTVHSLSAYQKHVY
jgi:hypothetical protein